jgi:hypothetical protein
MNWASVMETPILPLGYSQGYFRYYKTDGTYDEIVAIDGKLYKNTVLLPITGLTSFQTTKQIDAVQYAGTLYIATGTKLLQYDGTTCKVVDAYLPTTIEMTYIGTNALSDNPEGHLTDTSGLVAAIDYVYPSKPTGVVNTDVSVKVYCTTISGETYEYATQIQKSTSSTDFPDPATTAFKALGSDHSISVKKVGTSGDYTIRVSMRKVGTTTLLAQYDMEYTINKVADDKANKVAKPTIHTCNRATVYWGRLVLYGDPTNPSIVYLSQTNQPNYMPSLLTIDFENPKREPLNQLLQYRNGLLAFSDSSTQMLTGTSPDDYVRHMLHTDLGCISPKGAVTMTNNVAFLSQQGIYTLTVPTYTQSTTNDKANVSKIDLKIRDIVPLDKNAIAIFDNNQLQMVFPGSKMRLRYYLDFNAWAKDESDKFGFENMWNFNGDIHAQSGNMVYHFDKEVYTDDNENFVNSFESKGFSFNQPYHVKKLKEFHMLVAPKSQSMSSTLQVYADEQALTGEENGYASVNENGEVEWNVTFEPNIDVQAVTTLGDWKLGESAFGEVNYAKREFRLSGKCLRTKVKFSNTEPKENSVIGFAYVFKVKRPTR